MKLNSLESNPLVEEYLPKNLTEYGVNLIRYRIALAFRDFKITKSEMGAYVVHHKSETQTYYKVKLLNNYLFCTCMGYFNSGIPCEHLLLCSLTHGKKFLIH